eukprot:m51a1_g12942 hypothetical protein (283) ;mRNA; f:228-1247
MEVSWAWTLPADAAGCTACELVLYAADTREVVHVERIKGDSGEGGRAMRSRGLYKAMLRYAVGGRVLRKTRAVPFLVGPAPDCFRVALDADGVRVCTGSAPDSRVFPRARVRLVALAQPQRPGERALEVRDHAGLETRLALPRAPGAYEVRWYAEAGDAVAAASRRVAVAVDNAVAAESRWAGSEVVVRWRCNSRAGGSDDVVSWVGVYPGDNSDPRAALLAQKMPEGSYDGAVVFQARKLNPGDYEARMYTARSRKPLESKDAQLLAKCTFRHGAQQPQSP